LLRYWGTAPSVKIHDDEEMLRVDLGPDFGGWNNVAHLNVTPGEADNKIEEAISHYRPYRRPFIWYVTPSTRPRDLVGRLESHGFTHFSDDPGMAIELEELRDIPPMPSGFSVEYVEDEDALRSFFDIWITGYEYPAFIKEPFIKLYTEIGFSEDRPDRMYLGYLEGKPVATSMTYCEGDTAGVWWVAVLPEARRRGIGTVMTVKPLLEARSQGLRYGILISSQMGYSSYRRLGFQEYTKLRYWLHGSESPFTLRAVT
jgi:ribosomal protein S18 acetylase RimI-like enzyme